VAGWTSWAEDGPDRAHRGHATHTAIVIGIGFVVLGLSLSLGHLIAGTPGAAKFALYFLPVWLLAAGANMLIGVRSAGYGASEEFPVLLMVFAIPAAAAGLSWWRLH
jgi:hypothetical protein